MRVAKPRALFIAPILPARTGNGLAMRMGVFLEALANWADVDLAVIPVAGGRIENTGFLSSLGPHNLIGIEPEADTHYRLLSLLADPAERLDAFKAYGKPSLASGLSSRVKQQLQDLAERNRYDLIHIGRSYMTPAAPELNNRVPVTVDLDEDDRLSFSSRAVFARRNGNPILADWLDQEGRACDVVIAAAADRVRRFFAASAQECASLSRRHPDLTIEPVANTVEIPRRAPRNDDGRTILFVGSLGYQPNVDGLVWFAKSVLPALEAQVGSVRLLIAGRNPPTAVRTLGRRANIRVLGWVADLRNVYRRTGFAIAPMHGGGGTRIKVLEAASFGVSSVMNIQSAAGLFPRQRPWGWVCSHSADFIAGCAEAIRSPAERDRRGKLGYAAVVRHYSRLSVVARLQRTFRNCCS